MRLNAILYEKKFFCNIFMTTYLIYDNVKLNFCIPNILNNKINKSVLHLTYTHNKGI